MSEAAINRRKSQLFLTNISPVYDTHDEVIKKKLKSGKFPPTNTGIIKMISLCFQLGSIISWIVLERKCDNTGVSYSTIISISIGFIGQLILFLMFSFGKTVKDPATWINTDIAFNVFVSLVTIVACILSIKICHAAEIQHLSAALGISGAGISICGCASLFLLYRFVEDSDSEREETHVNQKPRDPRKSIFA